MFTLSGVEDDQQMTQAAMKNKQKHQYDHHVIASWYIISYLYFLLNICFIQASL